MIYVFLYRIYDIENSVLSGVFIPKTILSREFSRLYINFSKVLLKTDNKEIGR